MTYVRTPHSDEFYDEYHRREQQLRNQRRTQLAGEIIWPILRAVFWCCGLTLAWAFGFTALIMSAASIDTSIAEIGIIILIIALVTMIVVPIWVPSLRGAWNFLPVWGDWQRCLYRRRRRILNRFLRETGIVPETNTRLVKGMLVNTKRALVAQFQSPSPFTLDDMDSLAQRALHHMGRAYAEVTQPAPGWWQILMLTDAPSDPLAEGRATTWARENGLPILGRTATGANWCLNIGSDAWHLATQGMSRSGKSVFAYALLGALAQESRNGRIIIGGVDPTGILLGPWDSHPGDEYRCSGLHDLDAVVTTVHAAVTEMDTRIAQLRARFLDKIDPDAPDAPPTLLFVLEEYPGLISALKSADAGSKEKRLPLVKQGVQRLIQEGAKAGIRVWMIAQRMDAEIIGGSERSNLGTRISFRVDNADAVKMLMPESTPELVELIARFQPGYAVVAQPGEAPQMVRVDYTVYGEYVKRVQSLTTGDSNGAAT